MKPDPIAKMLETDLSAALQDYHLKKKTSETVNTWLNLYKLAGMCGYHVTSHCEGDLPLVFVTPLEAPDEVEVQKWAKARSKYRDWRARAHNDIHPDYIDRWTPNSKDEEFMKQVGIAWTTPSQEKKVAKAEPDLANDKRRKSIRSRRQAERLQPAALQQAAEKESRPNRVH